MDSCDLTPEQAQRLSEQVRRHLAYLHALRSRMDRRGFPGDDPLRQLVERAYDAVHHLSVDLHYRSCGDGVWK